MPLQVNEIFYSIQGESSYAGWPCAFVRLTGCNLRCSYCDTAYAYSEGACYSIGEIARQIASYKSPLVEITGGEPLIQDETPALVGALLERGYTVLLETNGSQDISRVDTRCVKIVDIKCPSSGQSEANDLNNLRRLTERDEVKFVIGNREDYDYAAKALSLMTQPATAKRQIHFSPVFGRMTPEGLAKWILDDNLNVRLHLQIHKLIWSPGDRGV